MAKISIGKYIFIFFCVTALLAFAIFATIHHCSNGFDHTEEYTVYKQVKDIKNLDSLREKLQTLNLEYSIDSKSLTLNDYSNISFGINFDDSCSINTNEALHNFELLDSENRDKVIINGTLQNNKITEKFIINSTQRCYIKQNNNYFVKITYLMMFGSLAYFFAALLLGLYIPSFIKDICNAKKS